MKVVILAGGFGTRLSEETAAKPKPMVEIGGLPILIHIMKLYSYYGCREFIICSGYRGWVIKEFFSNYYLHMSDLTFDMQTNSVQIHDNFAEPWKVTVVDTGLDTLTGGRVKRVQKYLGEQPFMLTYGDGLADINVKELLAFHQRQGKIATVTAVQPAGRFGSLEIGKGDQVLSFVEKPSGDRAWINGGFFVMQPEVFAFLPDDQCSLEREPLEKLARQGELAAYKHRGFWQPMDTLRDRNLLEDLWGSGRPPWRVW
ncbi:MAG: glucose-1-phosphate cytidylyltransferase [Syntrophomonas sp.]